jgi:maltodextrin utilization protein YvdJ
VSDWRDYVVAVIACLVFPVFIPVAIGMVIFMMTAAACNSTKEGKDVD